MSEILERYQQLQIKYKTLKHGLVSETEETRKLKTENSELKEINSKLKMKNPSLKMNYKKLRKNMFQKFQLVMIT